MTKTPKLQPNQLKPEENEDTDPADSAEEVRSGSQTAQDRDHTIRGGDNKTGPMKEFPT